MPTRDYHEWRLPQLRAMVSGDPHAQAAEHLNIWQQQVDLLAYIDVVLAIAEHPVDELSELSGGGKDGYAGALVTGDASV